MSLVIPRRLGNGRHLSAFLIHGSTERESLLYHDKNLTKSSTLTTLVSSALVILK